MGTPTAAVLIWLTVIISPIIAEVSSFINCYCRINSSSSVVSKNPLHLLNFRVVNFRMHKIIGIGAKRWNRRTLNHLCLSPVDLPLPWAIKHFRWNWKFPLFSKSKMIISRSLCTCDHAFKKRWKKSNTRDWKEHTAQAKTEKLHTIRHFLCHDWRWHPVSRSIEHIFQRSIIIWVWIALCESPEISSLKTMIVIKCCRLGWKAKSQSMTILLIESTVSMMSHLFLAHSHNSRAQYYSQQFHAAISQLFWLIVKYQISI